METDVAVRQSGERPVTSQALSARSSVSDVSRVAVYMLASCYTTNVMGRSDTYGTARIQAQAPKMDEVMRQVERLRIARDFARASGKDDDSINDISASIAMLKNLVSGPIPVPVAGWSADGGPALFFHQCGFYGDLEISGNAVEYFLKWADETGEREVYGAEEVPAGRLPPTLQMHLYRIFARSNADLR